MGRGAHATGEEKQKVGQQLGFMCSLSFCAPAPFPGHGAEPLRLWGNRGWVPQCHTHTHTAQAVAPRSCPGRKNRRLST